MSVKTCDACGASVTVVGKRDFSAHVCPEAGADAADATHPACPEHGTLMWQVGPYSTYRVCGRHWGCKAGKKGKPYRFCAPRGASGEADTDDTDDATPAVDTEGFPATKYAPTPAASAKDSTDMAMIIPTVTATDRAALLQALLAPAIDEKAIAAIVDTAVEKKLAGRVTTTLVVTSGEDRKVEIDSPHPFLQRVIRLVNVGIPVYLWGPAGAGKTTAGMQASHSLLRDSEIDTLDPSTFRSMIQGFLSPVGAPMHTSFTRCWTEGKVYIADECDNAPGHVQTLFNSALANGHAPFAWGNVERGNGFAFIGTGNTPGRPTREFPDRKPMSAAFADRMYFMHWPIDEQAERTWSGIGGKGKTIPMPVTREIKANEWVDYVQSLRTWATTNAPTLMITPRASITGLKALSLGESPEMVADALIFRGADTELRAKATNAVRIP